MIYLIDRNDLLESLGIGDECDNCKYGEADTDGYVFCTKGSDFVDACEKIFDAPSVEPWSAIKTMLNELERKQEKLYADYCDTTARLKAISKIAESDQKPNQKIDGIKPLAELDGTK